MNLIIILIKLIDQVRFLGRQEIRLENVIHKNKWDIVGEVKALMYVAIIFWWAGMTDCHARQLRNNDKLRQNLCDNIFSFPMRGESIIEHIKHTPASFWLPKLSKYI